jgi:hypothetical protein
MSQAKPLVVGSAFGLTVGIGYTICAIAVALTPALSYNFFSSLFHGANVSSFQPQEGAYTFGSYFISLVVLMAWGFVMGAFYSSVYSFLSGTSSELKSSPSSPQVATGRA